MRDGVKIIFVVIAAAFCVTLASGTVTTFKTGPFTGSVDLGMLCNDVNISKPVQTESLSGASYTTYQVKICQALIILTWYDKDSFNLNSNFVSGVTSDLIEVGADKDTFDVSIRKIDSKPGAVGSGYISKYDLTEYIAAFYVSPKSYCGIAIPRNETMMISALKTIHVAEAT